MFRKYDHVERLGHDEVQDITIGDVFVFPKLDGTNASVWFDVDENGRGEVCCGSRTRTLSAQADNAGFFAWVNSPSMQHAFLDLGEGCQNWILYGEWLVPHTLKTYREDAWRRFWVFDVFDRYKEEYLHYEKWEPTIRAIGLDIIEPMCTYTNPSDEQLQREAEQNTYLIMDGGGAGEGIVIKNYAWKNRFGRQPWAKIVRNQFKEENKRAFGTPDKGGKFQVEAAIAEEFCTKELVDKTRSKVVWLLINQDKMEDQKTKKTIHDCEYYMPNRTEERHRKKLIPQLLGTVFYEIVNEELWMALKKHKFPTVDFKKLRGHVIAQTKKHAEDLF